MKDWKYRLAGIACAVALTACGGGGGSGPQTGDANAHAGGVQVQAAGSNGGRDASTPSTSSEPAPTATAPESTDTGTTPAPATRPDVSVASMDEIAAWNAACTTDDCRITLPERSGRSLTWWGTDPRVVEQVNDTCGPQPDCRVPDGDLLVWNFDCSPQPTCRIRLSRAY